MDNKLYFIMYGIYALVVEYKFGSGLWLNMVRSQEGRGPLKPGIENAPDHQPLSEDEICT
jgi:hypothetical protein